MGRNTAEIAGLHLIILITLSYFRFGLVERKEGLSATELDLSL